MILNSLFFNNNYLFSCSKNVCAAAVKKKLVVTDMSGYLFGAFVVSQRFISSNPALLLAAVCFSV